LPPFSCFFFLDRQEETRSDLPATNLKLIHTGKVLKDADTVESCNIKPNAFLVVMVVKAKKAAPTPAPTPTPKPTTTSTPATAPAPAQTTTTENVAPSPSPDAPPDAPNAPSTETSPPAPTSTASAGDELPAEAVANLIAMGFPEAEVRACLTASQGNPDVAVEFLMNGIPPQLQALQQAAQTNQNPPSSSSTANQGAPLQSLRDHPQINQLRRLVQSNPQALQQVLTQIGEQQPDLLREINQNQQTFIEIMNQPVQDDAPASASNPVAPTSSEVSNRTTSPIDSADLLGGLTNPAQMTEMIQNMNPADLQRMAALMGLSPDQLTSTAQMINQMPPEQFQEYMNMAMQSGIPNMEGDGGIGGGQQVLQLSEEEMAAVNRLADMGFDRSEAAQAYIACDKNEALAANLLMDGGFGFGDGAFGESGGNNDDGDDMYD